MATTTYRNLDLVVSDYKADDSSATFRVQVIYSPVGRADQCAGSRAPRPPAAAAPARQARVEPGSVD